MWSPMLNLSAVQFKAIVTNSGFVAVNAPASGHIAGPKKAFRRMLRQSVRSGVCRRRSLATLDSGHFRPLTDHPDLQ